MPFFAGLVSVLFGSLFEYFAKYITRKIAFYAAMIASLTALTTTLYIAVNAVLVGIYISFPIPAGTVYAFLPQNAAACVSAYGGVVLLKWAYQINERGARIIALQ